MIAQTLALLTLRKKSPYSELFWSEFFPHFPRIFPHSHRIRRDTQYLLLEIHRRMCLKFKKWYEKIIHCSFFKFLKRTLQAKRKTWVKVYIYRCQHAVNFRIGYKDLIVLLALFFQCILVLHNGTCNGIGP